MFKLQRLEITGFKSFADYTEIVFTGNGITAVVGPNGCGKSNVSDCISWVLGEQRAKTLRGGELKDVIFQGSRNRKPSGMAEVVLHMVREGEAFGSEEGDLNDIDEALSSIDEHAVDMSVIEPPAQDEAQINVESNGNGSHPADIEVEIVHAAQVGSTQTIERAVKSKRHWRPRSFAFDFASGEAVSVTRRLYLSGESEYELNGRKCRLRDIQDLFAGTGLSGAHYAIIEQGRIGQILSAKPADRRNLIEEAAGISKFRARQRTAEARLDTAKTNLGRISDIVSEIEKQANSLRRQAQKTRRFIALQEDFRGLLRGLFAAEGRHLSAILDELAIQLVEAQKIESGFALQVAAQEENFRLSTRSARDAEELLSEIRRRHAENALERDRAAREHRYQAEQIVNFESRLAALGAEVETDRRRLDALENERSGLVKEELKESSAAVAADAVLREAEDKYRAILEEVRRVESDLELNRAEYLQHSTAVERFGEIGRQLQFNLERLGERAAGLARETVRADEAYDEHVDELARITAEAAAEQEKLDGLQNEKRKILEAAAEERERLRTAENYLAVKTADFSRARHRLETLQELEEKRAVYAPQIQKLFADQKKAGVALTGVIADFLNVDQRAEKAVEALFGTWLQTVIVETAADASRLTSWLSNGKAGRIAVLVAPKSLLGKGEPASSGSTVESRLGASTGFCDILRRVFEREMSALLVETLDDPAATAATAAVSYDGSVMLEGSLFIVGDTGGEQKNASLLAFKRELTELGSRAADLSAMAENAAAAVETARRALAVQEEKAVDLQSLIIRVERGLVTLEARQSVASQEIDRSERHKKVVADEARQMAVEIADVERRIAEAADNTKAAEKLRGEAGSGLEIAGRLLAEARNRADAANEVLNEKRTVAATSGERRRSVQSALRRLDNERKDLEARAGIQNLEILEITRKLEEMRASVAGISRRIEESGNETADEQREAESAIEAVTAARSRSDEASLLLADLNHQSADALNTRSALEIRQTEASTRLRGLSEKCLQDLNLPLPELMALQQTDEFFDLEGSRIEVDDLRRRLESFGAINMLAVEELAETEERLLFLTSQRQDIIDSIESAEEALREIKQRSRTRFKDAFEAINANFVEFFQELFGGGRGEMTLLESDDILEAGIEVTAQPPGKRLQNILLLSGGEKAMTAIALVLAIFKYRPSPFCLLDEVDAPLDEANVGRFVGKIADMSEKTQFIVITHNKRTMEAARALYGVTMQEAGVSKIVSVKFD